VAGVVDEDIDAAALGDDLLDGSVGRSLGLDVELDRAMSVPASAIERPRLNGACG